MTSEAEYHDIINVTVGAASSTCTEKTLHVDEVGRKQSSAVEKLLLAIVATLKCIVSILLKAPFPISLHPLLGLAIIYQNLTVV